jgi:hypothetical protein
VFDSDLRSDGRDFVTWAPPADSWRRPLPETAPRSRANVSDLVTIAVLIAVVCLIMWAATIAAPIGAAGGCGGG